MRVLRWLVAGALLAVVAGFLGGLLRRHTSPDAAVAYVPPEPATDEHVASRHGARPPTAS